MFKSVLANQIIDSHAGRESYSKDMIEQIFCIGDCYGKKDGN